MPPEPHTPAGQAINALLAAIAAAPETVQPMPPEHRHSHACRLLLGALLQMAPKVEFHEAIPPLIAALSTLDDAENATSYDEAATALGWLAREAAGRHEAAACNGLEARRWAAWDAASMRSHAGLG